MAYDPARRAFHRAPIRRARVAGLLVVLVALAALGDHLLASSTSTGTSVVHALRGEQHRLHGERTGALGVAGGAVPKGVTVFDDEYPAVANLDPALRSALRRASTDAAPEGVELQVDSGWRSPAYQEHLLEEAISKYGSRAEAARWVATPKTSPHVSGDAVDIGGSAAAAWLSQRGAWYGLCQIYGNEPWHYELRPEARDRGCPPMYADPTQDPRMRR